MDRKPGRPSHRSNAMKEAWSRRKARNTEVIKDLSPTLNEVRATGNRMISMADQMEHMYSGAKQQITE